ncbi:hypothetical protein [Lysinibacillus parviboronicapiens]|uniref:Archaellum component FlaC n=1 Tax=Lysinibacillus parviboronicapiens TaxID=436516 RepID=A0ABV2PI60_9BACI|nr:hypothetical protein [Lysinibacillus parviboronicapiens]
MEKALTQILGQLQQINQHINNIESRLDSIGNRLEILESEQQQIKQAVLETNEKVNRLEAIQESQHRIIELLSARSIQHEAELKRIQ